MRVLVAQADSSSLTAGVPVVLPVGLTRWDGMPARLGLVVKTTLTFQHGGADGAPVTAVLSAEQQPLSLDVQSSLPAAGREELAYASDFVFAKGACDVVVVGHAQSPRAGRRLDASFEVGDLRRAFTAVASAPAMNIPLSLPYLRAGDGESATEPVGPRRIVGAAADETALEDADLSLYQCAAPCQRTGIIGASASLTLTGLSPRADRRIVTLPGLRPRALVEAGIWGQQAVELTCDTLWIDADRERLVLCWRGVFASSSVDIADLDRVVLWLEREGEPRAEQEVRRALQRGSFGLAVEEEDLRDGRAVPVTAPDDARMARYDTWDEKPEPTVSLETYAAISAELAEKREPRGDTLRRYKLDEDGWALEERGWLERMGDEAMEGDGSLTVRYGELFMAAQDRLAGPGEARWTPAEYAQLKVDLEDSDDPSALLASRSMTLAQWMRIDRSLTKQAEADERLAQEIEQHVAASRDRNAAAEKPS